jgi:hypothetical protein
MSILKWMNIKKHRVITRTKAEQQNYINGVFPDATKQHHQFEYNDTHDE